MARVRWFRDLRVYRAAYEAAMAVFRVSLGFPDDERYGLTSQIRRSSRSVAANIAEAWRKRRYPAAFIAKLNDAEAEAAETRATSTSPSAADTWPATTTIGWTGTTRSSHASWSA